MPLDPEFDEVVKGDDYRVVARRAEAVGGRLARIAAPQPFEVRAAPTIRTTFERPRPH